MKRIIIVAAALLWAAPAFAAKLYIREYNAIGIASGLVAQIANEPAILDQTPVDFSAGVATSAAFSSQTSYVRIVCDVQCSVKFGAAPVATNANAPLPALSPEYFAVVPGQKISVISNP